MLQRTRLAGCAENINAARCLAIKPAKYESLPKLASAWDLSAEGYFNLVSAYPDFLKEPYLLIN